MFVTVNCKFNVSQPILSAIEALVTLAAQFVKQVNASATKAVAQLVSSSAEGTLVTVICTGDAPTFNTVQMEIMTTRIKLHKIEKLG